MSREFLLISMSNKQEIKLQQPYEIKLSKTTLPSTVTVKVTIVFPAALVAVTVNVSLSAGVTVLSCKVDKTEPDMTGNVALLVMVIPTHPISEGGATLHQRDVRKGKVEVRDGDR